MYVHVHLNPVTYFFIFDIVVHAMDMFWKIRASSERAKKKRNRENEQEIGTYSYVENGRKPFLFIV